jgi:hypothetical protein
MRQRRRRNEPAAHALQHVLDTWRIEAQKSARKYRHLVAVVFGGDVAIFHGSVTIVL